MLLSNEFINKTHFQKKAYERFKKTKNEYLLPTSSNLLPIPARNG